MPTGNPNIAEAGKNTRWQKGQRPVGAGKPKGAKHINTWVQELMEDPEFTATIQEGMKIVEFKGAPIKAIVKAQMVKALCGDTKAYDALVRSGWSQRSEVENSGEVVHKYEDLDDEQLEAALKARNDRAVGTA